MTSCCIVTNLNISHSIFLWGGAVHRFLHLALDSKKINILYLYLDLKKTMAVLLDDIMLRLNKLEQRADALANHTLARGRPEDWGQVQQKPNIPPPNEPPKVQPETEKNPVNMQGNEWY